MPAPQGFDVCFLTIFFTFTLISFYSLVSWNMGGKGLSFTNGYSWKKHQQFSISYFKNFGEKLETLQDKIKQECYFLCEAFKEEQGEFCSSGA